MQTKSIPCRRVVCPEKVLQLNDVDSLELALQGMD